MSEAKNTQKQKEYKVRKIRSRDVDSEEPKIKNDTLEDVIAYAKWFTNLPPTIQNKIETPTSQKFKELIKWLKNY